MFKELFFSLCMLSPLSADIIDDIIPVLIEVESNGNLKAVGDNGKALGQLQIWEVVVQDVNRVYKTRYRHEDAFDYYKSIEIAYSYLFYWGKHYEKIEGKKVTFEVLAKIWNGGPIGYKKKSTEKYWQKVKKVLN